MKRHFLLPIALLAACLACGCVSAQRPTEGYIEMRLAKDEPAEGFMPKFVFATNEKIYISPVVEVTERDIKDADAVKTHHGPAVSIHLSRAGARRLDRLVEEHMGDRLAILVADRIISVSYLKVPPGRQMLILGRFAQEEAEELAAILRGELMPAR